MKYTFRLKEGVVTEQAEVALLKADTVQVTAMEGGITSTDVVATIMKDKAATVIYSYERASDINKDGEVTLADLSIAFVYYQMAEATCDINLDGIDNTLEYVIIGSYIK